MYPTGWLLQGTCWTLAIVLFNSCYMACLDESLDWTDLLLGFGRIRYSGEDVGMGSMGCWQNIACHKSNQLMSYIFDLIYLNNVNIHIGKAWTAIDQLLTKWKSDLADKIKWEFFQSVAISVLLFSCTPGNFTKCLEKKKLIGIMQGCCMLFWTNPCSSTQQNNSCMATYFTFWKPS